MRSTLLITFLALFLGANVFAQSDVLRGRVVDELTDQALNQASVSTNGKIAMTDNDGLFSLTDVGAGNLLIVILADGFDEEVITVKYNGGSLDLGTIKLRHLQNAVAESGLSEISMSVLDGDDDNFSQSSSGLLSSSGDVFSSTAAYIFGPAFFRVRGYDGENQSIYMNGVPVNDIENGRASWSEWGGLNDVMRNRESVRSMNPTAFGFSTPGGASNILTRASLQRKQSKFSYSLTNRTYQHRAMFTHSTGMMANNWAFSFSGSRRWGNEGFVEGTTYDAWAYFLGVERKINANHSIGLTVYASPTRRGMQGPSVQEACDLAGTNYYNPNWGYQNGEKRNARIRNTHEPMAILNHYWDVTPDMKINNALSFSTGTYGTTALNWYNAADPRPDYYRYLPSYALDDGVKQTITDLWQTDPSVSQINWDRMYQINYLSNLDGKSARYIIEDRRTDQTNMAFTSNMRWDVNSKTLITAGIEVKKYKGNHYKTVDDLLGSEYWLDVDQFAERDFSADTTLLQNDLDNPNRKVTVGDRFGYDYDILQNNAKAWAQAEYKLDMIDLYGGMSYTFTEFWRDGHMRNGRAPLTSYGESEKSTFNDVGAKGGATFKITSRHFIEANGMYMTRAPYARNSFVSPRTGNQLVTGLTNEKIMSTDLTYFMRYPFLNVRMTLYHTIFDDATEINSFYHDELRTFVNHVMTNISKTHQGIEFGAELKVTSSWSVQGVAALGNYRYTDRANATISFDNGSRPDTSAIVYINNFYVPGSAQTAASVGLKYAGPGFLFFNLNANYFDNSYLDFNPERRTVGAISNLGPGDPLIAEITQQEKAPSAMTLDASIGKSWRIDSYYLNLNVSVTNILDNRDFVTSGFEQNRFDFVDKNVNKFPPKYFYYYGRTFFINLGFRF
ncbi:MAG: hypothetical protein Q7J34_00805 [Bacteroidales bacterium]|nr:hypothetical protein [Bacteroidales bacterium]